MFSVLKELPPEKDTLAAEFNGVKTFEVEVDGEFITFEYVGASASIIFYAKFRNKSIRLTLTNNEDGVAGVTYIANIRSKSGLKQKGTTTIIYKGIKKILQKVSTLINKSISYRIRTDLENISTIKRAETTGQDIFKWNFNGEVEDDLKIPKMEFRCTINPTNHQYSRAQISRDLVEVLNSKFS